MKIRLKIRHKLFLTLLSSSLLVAAGLFLFLQWNFDRGFLNYVNKQELELLNQLSVKLKDRYRQANDWSFIADNHGIWRQLHFEIFNKEWLRNNPREQPPPPPPAGLFPPHTLGEEPLPPPPKTGPAPIGRRVLLLDKNKYIIMGELPDNDSTPIEQPILVDGTPVGYLALIPAKELSNAGDLLFLEQQNLSFAQITGVMLFISFLISFLITGHLLRPINQLIEGTQKLIAGWFSTRIPVASRDELGVLSTHFNNLAATLEENEKARQLWVADMSHELRTPLAILQGEVEAMQDGIKKTTPENLAALHSELLHLGRLIHDLYELSMTDIGALTYKKRIIDPSAILRETCTFFTPRYQLAGLTLSLHQINDSSSTMLADPDRLQQLFTNILENSIRYTDSPGTLDIQIKKENNKVMYTFMDSGPGVPQQNLGRLFDRLYREEKSRNRASGGAGLGLSICKNITEAHQGSIVADMSPLGGLQITVTFPLY